MFEFSAETSRQTLRVVDRPGESEDFRFLLRVLEMFEENFGDVGFPRPPVAIVDDDEVHVVEIDVVAVQSVQTNLCLEDDDLVVLEIFPVDFFRLQLIEIDDFEVGEMKDEIVGCFTAGDEQRDLFEISKFMAFLLN